MTASDIDGELRSYFSNFSYLLSNIYLFGWESDFACCSNSGYWYEIEIKLSRGDFKADFKKTQKYTCFKKAKEELVTLPGHPHHEYSRADGKFINSSNYIHVVRNDIPHRFYYACPEGLIKKAEVPDYAGLFYLKETDGSTHSVRQVKAAKFLHKRKFNINSILLNKYYYRYLEQRIEILGLKAALREMENRFSHPGPSEADPEEIGLW